MVVVCAVVEAFSAQLTFRLGPIPYTFQNFGVILSGLALPPKHALLSQLLYLGMIGLGIPAASGFSGGIHVLVGYTAGYLWGFPISAFLMSVLSRWYLRISKARLDKLRVKDYVILILLSAVSVIPTYVLGFLVFFAYATSFMPNLLLWSSSVVRSLGVMISNPVLTLFITSVLIFIPQDVLMDHLAAILTSSTLLKYLKSVGYCRSQDPTLHECLS